MTTSGFAAIRARRNAAASNASATTPRAPSASIEATFSADRVVPVTVWPASRRSLSSGFPITPVAPATKIFMLASAPPSHRRGVDLRGVVVLEVFDRLAVGKPPGVRLGGRDH